MRNNKIYKSWNKVSLPESKKEEILENIMSEVYCLKKRKIGLKLVFIPICIALILFYSIDLLDNKEIVNQGVDNIYNEEQIVVNIVNNDFEDLNINVDFVEETVLEEEISTYDKFGNNQYKLKRAISYYGRNNGEIYNHLAQINLIYSNDENSNFIITLSEDYTINTQILLDLNNKKMKSKINNFEVFLFYGNENYYAVFEKNRIKHYIRVSKISETKFLDLVKEVISSNIYEIIQIEKNINRDYKTINDTLLQSN